jgi:translin
MNTERFVQSLEEIKDALEEEDKARDEVLKTQRNVIRRSSEAIKSIHREDFSQADDKIVEAQKLCKKMHDLVKGHPNLENWNGLRDAEQELGEALIVRSIITEDKILGKETVGISNSSYMLALCDVIGEMRRYLMDSVRKRDFDNAQRAFDYMDFIYSELSTVDYTRMLVGPLRSKVDTGRHLVQKSRTDLINAQQAYDLKQSMSALSKELDVILKKKTPE